ncbi:Alpha/Beta hydrolase protein [Terfezia claveryi]|nr:Alpha/Beta hydrolase protein [Terfezia claveryi]
MPSVPTSTEPIHPTDDVRVTHEFATVNGRKYHYVNGFPKGEQKGVFLLLHGFPDLWYSWRYIIPALLDHGFRVITPDLLGYGQTDRPVCTQDELGPYTHKSMSNDLAELLKQLNIPKVVVVGHDWGSYLAQRFAFFQPELVSHIVVIAVPFLPLQKQEVTPEDMVKMLPNFKYQLSFIDPEKFENGLKERKDVERLFRAFFQPKPPAPRPKGQLARINAVDSVLDAIRDVPKSDMITEEELQYYVDYFTRGGFHGPCNWYRTRWYNWNDEKELPNSTIEVPALFIQTLHDAVLPPDFVENVPQHLVAPKLTHRTVDTEHWAMMEDPDAINNILKEWITVVVLGGGSKL